jgi:hypothetical protein
MILYTKQWWRRGHTCRGVGGGARLSRQRASMRRARERGGMNVVFVLVLGFVVFFVRHRGYAVIWMRMS